MKLIQQPLLVSLAIAATSVGLSSSTFFQASASQPAIASQPATASQPAGTPKPTIFLPTTQSPRLNVETLVQALNNQDVTGAIRQVELGWKRQFEDYYQGRFTTQYLEPEQMARSLARLHYLTGKKTALIYAIPLPEQLELILVTPTGKLVHRRVPAAKRATLMDVAKTFRMGVVNPESASSDYLPAAKQLYEWIIGSLETDLQAQKIENLIFCVGSGLRSLPLAALHDGKQFLVEKYSLGIIPAFNLLDQNPAVLPGVKILAMGASEFEGQPPLPAVPTELTAITRNLWQGTSLINQDFTIANLKKRRAQTPYGIIHLATHAEFLPGSVNQSYIQFWDRQLHPTQFRELGLRVPIVQLLVLSACRTALGDPQAELGFAGLAVQSGSKAALASLWSVSDAGTLLLMTQFYQQLKTAPIKAEALRQAQLAMIRRQVSFDNNLALRTGSGQTLPPEIQETVTGNVSHPYYWAAFTMIGNPW